MMQHDVRLPSNISYDHAALLEPLSVAVHACKRAAVSVGSKVLICGAGIILGVVMVMRDDHVIQHLRSYRSSVSTNS